MVLNPLALAATAPGSFFFFRSSSVVFQRSLLSFSHMHLGVIVVVFMCVCARARPTRCVQVQISQIAVVKPHAVCLLFHFQSSRLRGPLSTL